jgi:hypothetical protein
LRLRKFLNGGKQLPRLTKRKAHDRQR